MRNLIVVSFFCLVLIAGCTTSTQQTETEVLPDQSPIQEYSGYDSEVFVATSSVDYASPSAAAK
jgi:hypothetical protein